MSQTDPEHTASGTRVTITRKFIFSAKEKRIVQKPTHFYLCSNVFAEDWIKANFEIQVSLSHAERDSKYGTDVIHVCCRISAGKISSLVAGSFIDGYFIYEANHDDLSTVIKWINEGLTSSLRYSVFLSASDHFFEKLVLPGLEKIVGQMSSTVTPFVERLTSDKQRRIDLYHEEIRGSV